MSYKDLRFFESVASMVEAMDFKGFVTNSYIRYNYINHDKYQVVEILHDGEIVASINVYNKKGGLVSFLPQGKNPDIAKALVDKFIEINNCLARGDIVASRIAYGPLF